MAQRIRSKVAALVGLGLSVGLTGCLPSAGAGAKAGAPPANPVTRIVQKVAGKTKVPLATGKSGGATNGLVPFAGDDGFRFSQLASPKVQTPAPATSTGTGNFVPQTGGSMFSADTANPLLALGMQSWGKASQGLETTKDPGASGASLSQFSGYPALADLPPVPALPEKKDCSGVPAHNRMHCMNS